MPGGPQAAALVESALSDAGADLTIPAFAIKLYQFRLE